MSYDTWKTGQDDYVEREHWCPKCDEKKEIIDGCTEFLAELVKQIYSRDDDLKLDNIDFCIEELCWRLDVLTPNGQPCIMRKRNPIYLLSDLIEQRDTEFLNFIKQ